MPRCFKLAIVLTLLIASLGAAQVTSSAKGIAKSAIKRHDANVKQLEREFRRKLSTLEDEFLASANESKAEMLAQLRNAQKLAQSTDLDQAVRIRDTFREKQDEDISIPASKLSGGGFRGSLSAGLISTRLLKQTKVKLSQHLTSKTLMFKVPAESEHRNLLVSIVNMADNEGDRGAYYSLSADGDEADLTFSRLEDSLFLFSEVVPGKSYALTLQDSNTKLNGIDVTAWLVTPLESSSK